MWSKQADTRNKQVTSLKSKISHRKRKNEKTKSPNSDNSGGAKKADNKNQNVKNKTVKEDVKKNVGPDLIENLMQVNVDITNYEKKEVDILITSTDEVDASVVLRKREDSFTEKQRANDINNVIKRYSDSYVHLDTVSDSDLKLSRAHSGFFLNTSDSCEITKEKKTRRFSDLFRPANFDKAKGNAKMISQFEIADNGQVVPVRETPEEKTSPPNKSGTASVKRTKSKNTTRENTKVQQKTKTKSNEPVKKEEVANNSVLKRVRSKIYKHKNENGVSAVPTMPDISENKEKKNKNKKNSDVKMVDEAPVKKPMSHFEFRMIRQTSNLEAIRPAYTHQKTQSVDGNIMPILGEKPILAKSKSSSAINLNLLRRRRLLLGTKNTKPARDEFDYISFGSTTSINNNNNLNKSVQVTRKFGSQDITSNINNNVADTPVRRSSWINNFTGETKPGNPVTRTPSDRRPDAVREESSRTQDPNQSQDNENDPSNVESSTSLPASTGNKRRQQSNVYRSESVKEHSEKNRKQRRNVSDPLHSTSETVDLDHGISSFHQHSGSSSNSSLSSRSLESPSGSLDIVGGLSDGQTERDSDMEVEADPPDWKSALTEEQLSKLPTHEKKRQDVINELFHTERSHVRNLKVLDQIFRKEIVRSKILTESELKLVFPNLPDLLGIHNQFNTVMKNKRKESQIVTEVGDILLNMFDGDKGIAFRNAAAKFCAKQQLALAFIKEKRKKDTKFENVLINCEKNNHCRRLPLQGFLPQEMQRLSKYPLLLERLIDNEEKTRSRCPDRSSSEHEKLEKALVKSREILNEVNDAAKRACNRARLEHINAHLDTDLFHRSDNAIVTEYKYFDLMKYTLIYEGTVTLRRQNKTPIPVHMLLTEEAVILLVKEGERYLLKFFHSSTGQQSLAPIIKMQNVICRKNAADNVTLYLVSNTQNSQMYEIQCRDSTERKMWFKYFTDASEPYKLRDGKGKRSERAQDPEEETVQDLPASRSEPGERAEAVSDDTECAGSSSSSSDPNQRNSDVLEDGGREDKSITQIDDGAIPAVHAAGGEGLSVKLIPNDWPLIQPSEVQVAIPPVHTAEPVLTALEQIKRKDEEVKQALAAKEVLVADLLSIPREDFHLIADIASDEATNKESSQWELSELVLAAAYQVDQLIEAVNESLNITESDAVLAMGGKHPSCASNESVTKVNNYVPSVPASKLQLIATTLNSQLTILMSAAKGVEEDRDRLRKELHRNREQLHEKSNLHGPLSIEDECTQLDSTQSGDLESIEESPTETETT